MEFEIQYQLWEPVTKEPKSAIKTVQVTAKNRAEANDVLHALLGKKTKISIKGMKEVG